MARFARKIYVVEAIQWFPGTRYDFVRLGKPFPTSPACHLVDTTSGPSRVYAGDWIIIDASGIHQVVKDAVFRAIYDPVAA